MKPMMLVRLVRLQFAPVIVMPVVLGASVAWFTTRSFQFPLFALCLVGAISLHVAANAIDDVYDYSNGVDSVSDQLFPKDAPGWKPIPRGLMSVGEGFAVASLFYLVSVMVGIYLSLVVGWLALAIAVPGIILSWVYTAPPFKLDYRGLGLGEISILVSFGPLPALGAYYVLAHQLSILPVLASIPTGLLTTDVLVTHDLIFYEPYKTSGKRSLAVTLGRQTTAKLITTIAAAAFAIVVVLVAGGFVPTKALLVLASSPLAVRLADLGGQERSPAEYGSRTTSAFLLTVTFTGLLALGLVL